VVTVLDIVEVWDVVAVDDAEDVAVDVCEVVGVDVAVDVPVDVCVADTVLVAVDDTVVSAVDVAVDVAEVVAVLVIVVPSLMCKFLTTSTKTFLPKESPYPARTDILKSTAPYSAISATLIVSSNVPSNPWPAATNPGTPEAAKSSPNLAVSLPTAKLSKEPYFNNVPTIAASESSLMNAGMLDLKCTCIDTAPAMPSYLSITVSSGSVISAIHSLSGTTVVVVTEVVEVVVVCDVVVFVTVVVVDVFVTVVRVVVVLVATVVHTQLLLPLPPPRSSSSSPPWFIPPPPPPLLPPPKSSSPPPVLPPPRSSSPPLLL